MTRCASPFPPLLDPENAVRDDERVMKVAAMPPGLGARWIEPEAFLFFVRTHATTRIRPHLELGGGGGRFCALRERGVE